MFNEKGTRIKRGTKINGIYIDLPVFCMSGSVGTTKKAMATPINAQLAVTVHIFLKKIKINK